MKCLNLSLPLVKQALSVIKSEPLLAKILDNIGDTSSMEDIMAEYESMSSVMYQLDPGMIEKNNKQLDSFLLNFLKPFGVQSKEFNDLKERLGIDALGATDVLNKLIWYNKDREIDTLPEEASHMIVMLMGESNPDVKYLLDNITKWSEYKSIYNTYMPIYKNEKQVKIEAVGKLVAKAIVKNFKESGLDKSLLERAIKLINDFFNKIFSALNNSSQSPMFTSARLADKIAINVLSGNTDYIASLTNSKLQLDYQKAIANNPHARNIINTFTGGSNNFKLVGSLAIAGQGEKIYRPENEPIHDLDFTVSFGANKNDYRKSIQLMGGIPAHNGWKNTNYITEAYYIPAKGYEVKVLRRRFRDGYAGLKDLELIEKSTGKVVPINSKNLMGVDFFVYDRPNSEVSKDIFASWQDIYAGKLGLSVLGANERMFQRSKDQQDYVLSTPNDLSVSLPEFVYYQQETQSEQAPDPGITQKINRFLSSIGVNVERVNQLRDREGKPMTGVAMADMLNRIINVVEGKEDLTTLPEEAAHFFIEMLGTSSPLYREMYDKITSYKLYSETVASYKDNKLYRNQDGTINFDKLKKEAIGKVIMSYIISQETGIDEPAKVMQAQKWWQKVWQYITSIFSKAPKRNGAIENPFATAARRILSNDTTDLDQNNLKDDIFLQADDFAGKLFDRVKADQARITLEPKEHVYQRDGKDIRNADGSPRSVSENVVKPWYKSKFPVDRRSDIQKMVDDIKAEYGTGLHDYIEKVIERFVDPQIGLLRDKPLDPPATEFNLEIQSKLTSYIQSLLTSYPAGTRFMAEVKLYNSRKNLPGTTDLLVFLKDGSVDVYDWKSQEVRDNETELKWFKEPAYRLQLDEYTEALEKEYGILKFNKVRAIPIRTIFKNVKMQDSWVPTNLKNIEIGPINPSMLPESKEYLLPVVALKESTGDKMLDELIEKLNYIYDQISQKSTKDKDKKALELNKLKKTIRTLQVKQDMKHFVLSGLLEIEKYQDKLLNNKLTVGEALQGREIVNAYAQGSKYLKVLLVKLKKQIEQEQDETVKRELQEQQDDYKTMALNAQDLVLSLENRAKELTDEIARNEGIKGILNPERVMDYLKRNFRSLSTLDTAGAQLLNRLLGRARQQRDVEIDEKYEKLESLKESLEAWASSNGISNTKMFDGILDGTDFLNIYSKEWMEQRKQALKRSDAKWIQDNTVFDKEAYEAAFKKYKEAVMSDTYSTDPVIDKEKKEKTIIRWIELHNGGQSKIAILMNKGNFLKPKEQWYSEKYKNLLKPENKPLKDVYDYFQELLRDSQKAGMIDYEFGFIPSLHKTKLEAFVFGDYKNMAKRENFFSGLAVDSANQFGKVDPLTGKPILEIPVYYTRDLGEQKSLDLFKVFGVWAAQTANYKAMSNIEDTANALLFVEQTKGSLQTNIYGKVKKGSKIDSNTVNAEVLENHINYQIYGQKIDLSEDKVVKIMGKDVSVTRGLQKIMHYFSLKTLAFNPISGTAQLVGGTLNASFIAGKDLFFSDKDWGNGIVDFSSRNTEAYGFLDFIAPELEDTQYRKSRQLSISNAVKRINAEDFFIIQRVSDKLVIYPVALAMFRSHMLDENGKIVYIRDYVKKKYDYENIYNLPSADRKALIDKIDKEVDELKKTSSLKAKSKIVDGKFEIEGLKRDSNEVMMFRNKIKKVNKTIIGNSTTEDINQIRMGMMGQIFMQFRSWIPQMITERFGDMSYDAELETYNYGKARTFFKHFFDKKFLPLISELIIGYGDNAIERAKERYREMLIRRREVGDYNFEERMSEAQFIDMYLANLRSMKRELLMLLAFIGLIAWMRSDDDDDERTPGEKLMARAIDKYFNELAFFYNPTEARILLKSPAPVTGLLEDMYNFFDHSSQQLMGFGLSDEKVMKDAHPMKYFNKMFPGVKVGQDMFAIFDDDFRKEMGLR